MKSTHLLTTRRVLRRRSCCGVLCFLLAMPSLPAFGDQFVLSYAYDANSRLTVMQISDGTMVRYFYDAAGNRTAVTSTIVPTTMGDYNRDGSIDLKDGILSLQVTGNQPIRSFDLGAEINGDGKIGLAETIYILRTISH